MVMKTRVLRRYIEPLLAAKLPNLHSIRIGTKALAYWPYRFTGGPDADDFLRLIGEVKALVYTTRRVRLEAQKSVRTLCKCDEINAELEDVSTAGGAPACAAKAYASQKAGGNTKCLATLCTTMYCTGAAATTMVWVV